MKRLPVAVIVYAALAVLSGIANLASAIWIFWIDRAALGTITADALWGVFSVCLGVGVLRLRPAWRVVALAGCWISFIVFFVTLIGWCIRPQSVHWTALVVVGAAAGLNLWFYLAFRGDEVRSLFLGGSLHTVGLTNRARRWITVVVTGGVVVMAWLWWNTLHNALNFDIHAEAARSTAIVYGTVRDDAGRRSLVIDEIWKRPTGASELTVGTAIPVPQLPADAHPQRLVVFLERSPRGGLRAGSTVAVNDGQLGWPEMSVEDAKAICSNAPSI